MVAASGATGVRAWLTSHLPCWMTPKRLRVLTMTLFAVTTLASSVTLSGTSVPKQSSPASDAAPAGQVR